jgi:hypothetical protein
LYIKDFQNKNVTCAWLNKIRCILNDCGMSYIWNMKNCISDKWLKLVVKNNLVDQYKQTWTSMIENSSKGDHTNFNVTITFGVDVFTCKRSLHNFR